MALSIQRPASGWRRVGLTGLLAAGTSLACGAAAAFVGPVYALGGVVGAAVGAAMLANVRIAMLAFLAIATLLPYGVVPVPVGGVRLTFLDFTLTLLLVTWVMRLLVRRERELVSTPLDLPLIAFIVVAIAAFIFGTAYAFTAETLRLFLKLINSMLFFFTATQLVRSRRDLELLLRALVIGGALAAAIGIALYHLPPETASRLLRSLRPLGYPTGEVLRYIEDAGVRTSTLRATGTSVDPNVFGALLLMTGSLALGQMLAARGVLRRWLAVALLLIGYALLLSLSRGSWIGFGVAAATLVLVAHRRVLLAVPVVAIVAALLFGPALTSYGEHFMKAVYARDQATGMRLGEYKDALRLIQQNPVLGVGFDGTPSSDLYLGVSSTYLLVAEEMGLVGLTLYLSLIGTVVAVGVRAYRRSPDARRPVLLACLAAFLGVCVSATFDHHYFNLRYQHITALYWLLAASVLLAARLPMADQPRSGT